MESVIVRDTNDSIEKEFESINTGYQKWCMIQFITWKEENAMQKMKGLWLFEA